MRSLFVSIIAALLLSVSLAEAETKVGAAAPDFSLPDASGAQVSLASFKGKNVVLEWFNPGCPFVKKFYRNGDMQRFQEQVLNNGGVWLTISSSAAGKQGHITPEEAQEVVSQNKIRSSALLLDSNGAVGKTYGARTTPHMFVIDAKGTLVYDGAIDSEPSTDSSDIAGATNYVLSALEALKKGRPVSPASTDPYGCSVKYK
jgi:peroxiredoxin